MLAAIKNRFRRWQLSRYGIAPQVTRPTFTAGDRSGVWTVLPDLLSQNSVIYSVGVGDNVSWDLALIEHFGVTIHAFDPTPASVAWIAEQDLPASFHFHATGLAGKDGKLTLARRHQGRFNFRPREHVAQSNADVIDVPVARLISLMRRLGHARLDVLKMDIEGEEYAVLDDMLSSGIHVRQLLVEFHHHFPAIGIERTVRAVRALREAGYRVFHISPRGLEFGFVLDI